MDIYAEYRKHLEDLEKINAAQETMKSYLNKLSGDQGIMNAIDWLTDEKTKTEIAMVRVQEILEEEQPKEYVNLIFYTEMFLDSLKDAENEYNKALANDTPSSEYYAGHDKMVLYFNKLRRHWQKLYGSIAELEEETKEE